MPSSRSVYRALVGDIPLLGVCERTATGHIGHELMMPAAHAGTLPTRTDNTSGILGFDHGTGIAEGDLFDMYWAGGRRYAALAGALIGNHVPFGGGGGDWLPPAGADIVAMEEVVISTIFDGDLLRLITAGCDARAFLGLWYNSDILALGVDLTGREVWRWADGGTAPNPLSGDAIAYATISHADASSSAGVQLALLYDSLEVM